ncbi:uncharacterized protein LOC109409342 [Aedes albopictus]|uniref:SAM domain-containing protein n=1 Tax=Aedes albopictus TaxID=7160 RepID=A0ABM1YKJ5_AEDAL
MAAAGQSEDDDLVEEYIVDEELVKLLKSFELSATGIEEFVANGYDISALKIIEREEIEALLPPPHLADRTKCIAGLNEWRRSLGLPSVSTPLKTSNLQGTQNSDPPKVALGNLSRQQWNAKALINRSKKGRLIWEAYQITSILSRKDRIFITHLIIDEFVDEFGRLTREELACRATELKNIFPTVEQHVWYKPASYQDEKGKKIKLGRIAKGCLFDRNHNYRCATSVPPRIPGSDVQPSTSSAQPIVDVITADAGKINMIDCRMTFCKQGCFFNVVVTAYQETKNWFRHHHGEFDDIKKRWEASCAVRLHETAKLERVTYQHLLDEYPVLRNTAGYQLVNLDFSFKHPTKTDLLFAKFADFRIRAKLVFPNEVPELGKPLLALLNKDISEDSRDCITTLLLFFIWPSTVMRLPNGKKWKPSLVESSESTILHLKTLADYETELSRLSRQNLLRGLPDYPVIVVVGPSIEHVNQFFVSYKDIAYKAETFIKALDITFKVYEAYGISFPSEANGPWSFMAYVFYDFEPPENGNKARILTLATHLRNQVPAQ